MNKLQIDNRLKELQIDNRLAPMYYCNIHTWSSCSCLHSKYNIAPHLSSSKHLFSIYRQLGGLVVKSFACCAGGLGSIPGRGTQNFQMAFISKISASLSIACDIKPEGALYSVFYAEASKRPHTWELKVPCVDSQPYHLIIKSASGSCLYKLIKLQSQ